MNVVFFLWWMCQNRPRPILVIPGLGGSILYESSKQNIIWPPQLSHVLNPCVKKDLNRSLKVSYHHSSRQFYLPVPTSTYAVGETDGLKLVNRMTGFLIQNTFYNALIHTLQSKFGRDCIHGVPYDFRLVGNPFYLETIYQNMSRLIETQVDLRQQPCIIIAHSLGGMLAHDYLVHHCSYEWKQKYIRQFISINAPFGGCPHAIHAIQHRHKKFPYTQVDLNLDFMRYISGLLWCMPNRHLFSNQMINQDVFHHPFYIHQLREILTFMDTEETFSLYHRHFDSKLRDMAISPNVSTHVIYSHGYPTIDCLRPHESHIYGEGDGTVPLYSLEVPRRWNHTKLTKLVGEHTKLLNSPELLSIISENND